MFLVKRCKSKDNIKKRHTLRIGSLHEYRQTEEKQIADKEEGTYDVNFDMHHVHIPKEIFHQIFHSHNSLTTFYAEHLILGGQSPILKECTYFPRILGKASLDNLNRLVFCMSLLEKPSEAENLFPDYDDSWHLKFENTKIFANLVANQIKKSIYNRLINKEELFDVEVDRDNFHVQYTVQTIEYRVRNQTFTNHDAYLNPDRLYDTLSGVRFIKPLVFDNEREVRMCFDIISNGMLLHPKINSLIVDINDAIHLVE